MSTHLLSALRLPLAIAMLSAGLVGCENEPPPENNDGCTGEWYADYLGDIDAVGGDASCFGGSTAGAAPVIDCVEDQTIPGTTVDHQEKDPIEGVDVEVWFTDDHTLTPNVTATSGAEGAFEDTMPVCQAFSYRTDRGPNADPSARVTLAQHKVIDPTTEPFGYDFRSVSDATVDLVSSPLFYGVPIEEGKGMVFGQAIGCDGEALENVQVLVRDADCSPPAAYLVGYTSNEVPNVLLRGTSTDGYFFAVNVPAGEWVLEMYSQEEDGSFTLLGSAPATMEPDGVTLVDIKIGRDDGVHLPDACVSCG